MPSSHNIHPSASRLSSFKQSKQPYHTSEERNQSQQIAAIVSSSEDAIISKSLDGIVLSWNQGAERMYGYAAEEIIGRSIGLLFPPERQDELENIMTKIRQGEHIHHFETEQVCKDGTHILVSVSVYGIRDLDGKLVRAATIARNITSRKEMEARLHQKQQELEIILQGITDGIVVRDAGRLLYVNDAAVHMGKFLSAEEMMAIPPKELAALFEFFDEAGAPIAREDLPSSLALRGIMSKRTVQYRIKHTGDARWIIFSSTPVKSLRGDLQFIISIFHDITEQREAQEALEHRVQERTRDLHEANLLLQKEIADRLEAEEKDKANLRRLQEILDSLPMGAIASDENGTILHVNDRFCTLLGLPVQSKDLIGKNKEIIPAILRDRIQHFDAYTRRRTRMLESRAPMLAEEIMLKDGRMLLRDYIPLFVQDTFCGHLALYRDVTQERRIDATKSEFMSLASHQLRTPLTAIRWALGRLGRLIDRHNTKEMRLLHEARSAAIRMTETINTMLAISRIEGGKMTLEWTDVALQPLLESLQEQYKPDCAKRGHTLSIHCPPALTLHTDANFLKEILQNLLTNAVKYTPDNGIITVKATEKNTLVTISIADTGYGIPMHQHERIFTKFFRGDNIVDKETDGTGLGLYLVSLLAQMLGGSMSFESAENKGTTFHLTLPKN